MTKGLPLHGWIKVQLNVINIDNILFSYAFCNLLSSIILLSCVSYLYYYWKNMKTIVKLHVFVASLSYSSRCYFQL